MCMYVWKKLDSDFPKVDNNPEHLHDIIKKWVKNIKKFPRYQ